MKHPYKRTEKFIWNEPKLSTIDRRVHYHVTFSLICVCNKPATLNERINEMHWTTAIQQNVHLFDFILVWLERCLKSLYTNKMARWQFVTITKFICVDSWSYSLHAHTRCMLYLPIRHFATVAVWPLNIDIVQTNITLKIYAWNQLKCVTFSLPNARFSVGGCSNHHKLH